MQSGFNTNYRHRGVLFHVQTEDSGVANPHIVTHLFHGGNILASQKREYSEKLGAADLEAEVRVLMEDQHKEMLRALSRGDHDAVITERLGAAVFLDQTDCEEPGSTAAEMLPPRPEAPPPAAVALPAAGASAPEPAADRIARAFGDGIVSDKPLDEVVLDYLVENARKRKRRGSGR